MPDPLPPAVSRRRFLAGTGVVAGAAVLGACGGGGSKDKDQDKADDEPTSSKYVLAQFFGNGQFAAGQPIRAPFGIADGDGMLLPKDAPDEVEVVVLDPDDKQVGPRLTVRKHAKGLPRPYYPLEVTLDDPGIYSIKAVGGLAAGNSMALGVSDPKDLGLVRPGVVLPPLETPTLTDARGVTPICTRDPICPLHDVTLAQALQMGQPVGLVISTPAFCQVSICGPVLDLVLDVRADHPGVTLIHAEVYADPHTSLDVFSPTITALGLPFEPVLVLADAKGTVVQRLDSIWDRDELGSSLSSLT